MQFIKQTDLKNKFFIILDADGRDETNAKKYYKGIFETNTGMSKSELKDFLDNRFYTTENSTMIETLTFNEDNTTIKGTDLSKSLDCFIDKNLDEIKKSLELKVSAKIINEEEKKQILNTLHTGDLSDKLLVLKKVVITKTILKKFRNEVCLFKTIDEIDVEHLEKYIPVLKEKLKKFLAI